MALGDRRLRRIGLGTNRITDTEAARTLLRRAVELGVELIDTADIYQATASETTIGATLGGDHPRVVVATKGGMVRTAEGYGADGRPEYLRTALVASLRRLGADRIDLYQLHRVDPHVPIELSVGALREMQREGLLRWIGLSNVTVEELDRARREATIVSVQNRYNLLDREHEAVLEYCERHGIVFLPWTPFRRGGISEEPVLAEMAARLGATAHQLALRWLLWRSPVVLPIPGTLSVRHLEENLAAAALVLEQEELRRLGELAPPAARP